MHVPASPPDLLESAAEATVEEVRRKIVRHDVEDDPVDAFVAEVFDHSLEETDRHPPRAARRDVALVFRDHGHRDAFTNAMGGGELRVSRAPSRDLEETSEDRK